MKRTLTALLLALLCAQLSAAESKPNIVFLLIDDPGFADCGLQWREGHPHAEHRQALARGSASTARAILSVHSFTGAAVRMGDWKR